MYKKQSKAPYSKFHVNLTTKGKQERTTTDLLTGNLIKFDSLSELQFYEENIVPGMENGDILSYQLHKSYELQPSFKYNGETIRAVTYESDFVCEFPDHSIRIYDVKGSISFVDDVAILKRKLFRYKYPDLDYIWIVRTSCGWVNFDELVQQDKEKKKAKKAKVKKENK